MLKYIYVRKCGWYRCRLFFSTMEHYNLQWSSWSVTTSGSQRHLCENEPWPLTWKRWCCWCERLMLTWSSCSLPFRTLMWKEFPESTDMILVWTLIVHASTQPSKAEISCEIVDGDQPWTRPNLAEFRRLFHVKQHLDATLIKDPKISQAEVGLVSQ